MLYEILPDPLAIVGLKGSFPDQVLQFHRTIPDRVPIGHFERDGTEVVDEMVSRSSYLDRIRQACIALGNRLQLRFYDHFEEEFDASVLDELGDVHSLAIDGLDKVQYPEAIGRLPRLTSLVFGPRHLDDSRILNVLGVHRLTHFTLAATPTPRIDLGPLAEATSLRSLRLLGHGKNTEAIGDLTSLTELAIQPSSKFSLAFISRLTGLESLKFVLGTATSIGPVGGLPALRDLSVREVRNLEDLGDLQRFPRLRRLQVSDQPRIAEVQIGKRNQDLAHLYLYSVPRLRTLAGFSDLARAKSLFAYDSRLELTWSDLPATLTHFQLLAKATKGRAAHDAEVVARGMTPAVHPEATFFYK